MQGAQRGPQLIDVADPPGRLAAHARRWLEHERKSDLGDECLGIAPVVDQTMSRARQTVATQLVLHPGLVAEQISGLGVRSGDPELAPELGELDLERLEDADHPVDRAMTPDEDTPGLAQ